MGPIVTVARRPPRGAARRRRARQRAARQPAVPRRRAARRHVVGGARRGRRRRAGRERRPRRGRARGRGRSGGRRPARRRARSRCRPRSASGCATCAAALRRGRLVVVDYTAHRSRAGGARRSRVAAHLPRARARRRRRWSPPASRTSPSTCPIEYLVHAAAAGRVHARARRHPGRVAARARGRRARRRGPRRVGRPRRTSATSRRSATAAGSPRPPRSRPDRPRRPPVVVAASDRRVLRVVSAIGRVVASRRSIRSSRRPGTTGRGVLTAADERRGSVMAEKARHDRVAAGRRAHVPAVRRLRRAGAHRRRPTIYAEAEADPEAFWAKQAGDLLDWFEPWHTVLEWDLPFAKWFLGGKLNVVVQLPRPSRRRRPRRQGRLPLGGRARRHPHHHLRRAARRRVASSPTRSKALGVEKGDRVNIYLGMVPELPMALLACARIGAAHSVVFGGLLVRLAARPHQRRGGQGAHHRRRRVAARAAIVPLKETADDAVAECPTHREGARARGAPSRTSP